MHPPRILVVEDEGIVAHDLQYKLRRLGYEVPAVASSGEEAIRKADEHRPDLVLMDIVLKGQMDGVEAAALIWERLRIPAVYLTAYGDDATLQRAKVTRPYGYVLKPFSKRELRINIEVALYRNQMERKLQGVERWLSSPLSSLGDAVIETDAEGRIVLMNPHAAKLTGWSVAEAAGRPAEEVVLLRDRQTGETVPGPVLKTLQEETLVSLEEQCVLAARGGAEIPVSVCTAPIRAESGAVRGAVLLFRDLSRLQQAERAQRETEESFRLLVENVQDYAIFMLDPGGRVVTWNQGAERITGYRAEEIVGRHFSVFYTEDAARKRHPQRELKIAVREGRYEEEGRRVRKDGSCFWASVVVTPLYDEQGRVRGFAKVTRDITASKDAEAALRESNSRLSVLTETATAALRGGPAQAFITAVYRKLADYLGLEVFFHYQMQPEGSRMRLMAYGGVPDEVVGPIEWLELGQAVCGCVAQQGQRMVAEDIQAGSDPRTELVRSLGITAYACHPLVAQGRVIGTLSFGSRTRTRFAADELSLMQAVSDQVALAVERAQLEMELRERAERLLEADQRKDQFLAMLAHELRNPLGAISNAMAVLNQIGPQEERAVRTRTVINRQLRHLSRMVDDLLDVSRLTRDLVELRKEPVDLAAAISDAEASVRPLLDSKSQELTVSLPPGPIILAADAARLQQIIGNLLGNAVRYTQPGGKIAISVEVEDGAAGAVVMRVKDTGVGIDRELLPRIFDLFTQADRSLARSEGGLGIGLTLVKGLVELHGGLVEAFSDGPGLGSEFLVRLPLLRSDAVAPPAPACPRGSHGSKRILIVEDNTDAAETLGDLLRAWGHEVQAALDGPAALQAASTFHPEVVLCDIGMPGMDGYEVARRLRQQGLSPGPLLVALTGYGQAQDRHRARDAGFDLHLTKPVDPEGLRQLIGAADPMPR